MKEILSRTFETIGKVLTGPKETMVPRSEIIDNSIKVSGHHHDLQEHAKPIEYAETHEAHELKVRATFEIT